jgi:N-acetylglucosaminyl-diphospho-decaprenol L-rhamnosyltransferase
MTPTPSPTPGADVDVTALVVNYNTRELLAPCIESLRTGSGDLRLQTVIVDNASRDGSPELLRRDFADCDLLFNDANVGFGRANNQALALARGRYVLLLNTDAFVPQNGVADSVRFLESHPQCGIVGVRLVGRDGSLQPSCRYFPTPWNEFLGITGLGRFFPGTRLVDDMAWDHAAPRECDWVPGCYYLMRRSVVDAVGLFDPRYFLYYEEIDHCRAVKSAGWQVMFDPAVTVVHIGGESARTDAEITSQGRQIPALQIESGLLYFRKHYGFAGACAAVALALLSASVLTLKGVLRGRSWSLLRSYWANAGATWALLRRTAGGLRPTR